MIKLPIMPIGIVLLVAHAAATKEDTYAVNRLAVTLLLQHRQSSPPAAFYNSARFVGIENVRAKTTENEVDAPISTLCISDQSSWYVARWPLGEPAPVGGVRGNLILRQVQAALRKQGGHRVYGQLRGLGVSSMMPR